MQIFWAAFMLLLGASRLTYMLTLLPLLVGVFLLSVELGISRLILQKIAKYLFYLGILRSTLLVIYFIMYFVHLFQHNHETSVFTFLMMGLNAGTEVVTTVISLRVVRYTNEIITLINKKMLKSITEGEFNYNC